MTPERVTTALKMRADGATLETIARTLGVGETSVRRALTKAAQTATGEQPTHPPAA